MIKWTEEKTKDLYEYVRIDGMDHKYFAWIKLPTICRYNMDDFILFLTNEIEEAQKRQSSLGNVLSNSNDDDIIKYNGNILKVLTCDMKELPLLINFDIPISQIVKWRLKNKL